MLFFQFNVLEQEYQTSGARAAWGPSVHFNNFTIIQNVTWHRAQDFIEFDELQLSVMDQKKTTKRFAIHHRRNGITQVIRET